MTKKIVITEKDNIGAVIENGKVTEFFVHKGDVLLGDVYLSKVDNILPSIEAAFVDVGLDKMGFIHTDDIMGKGTLKEKVKPKQKLVVQVVKEPTGHKGPRMTTALSLPGRFLVLLPEEKGVNVSKKITSAKERARLKSVVSLLKPVGVGIIVRTEAEGHADSEIQEDIEMLLEKWHAIITAADTANPPALLHRDQDLLYRIIREACSEDVEEIIVDTPFALHRTTQLLQHWNMQNKTKVTLHKGSDPLLQTTGVTKEIQNALNTKVNLPLGGYLFIQQTEALTVIDVNSGKFVSSGSQAETILKTNLQASEEIARQLKLRNIGGMIIVDFIDMTSRIDKLKVLEHFEIALSTDKAKPQIGQLSDLGLVELTRHRQGQSLAEVFTRKCDRCGGSGYIVEEIKLANPNAQGEMKAKMNKIKGPFASQNNNNNGGNNNQENRNNQEGRNNNQENRSDNQNNRQENQGGGRNNKFNKFNKNKFNNRQQNAPTEDGTPVDNVQTPAIAVVEQAAQKTDVKPEVMSPEKTEVKAAEVKESEIKAVENKAVAVEAPATQNVDDKYPAKKVSRKAKKADKKAKEFTQAPQETSVVSPKATVEPTVKAEAPTAKEVVTKAPVKKTPTEAPKEKVEKKPARAKKATPKKVEKGEQS